MTLRPLFKDRAVLLEKERTLLIAELHLGYELEIARSGISVPSPTTEMLERLKKLVKKHKARKVIVLGDVKHTFNFLGRHEELEVMDFFSELRKVTSVEVVRGNHDGDLDSALQIPLHPVTGIKVGKTALVHGHAWPSKDLMTADYLVMGHLHPSIALADFFGVKYREACWLLTKFKPSIRKEYPKANNEMKVVVLPAFNKLLGGAYLNEEFTTEGFANELDYDNGEVVLLDGTNLGALKNID